ncbi:hypothetical protein NY08_1708 [Rhodococcus sp. B7740]|nr:hypothetical protein NY08_1708 [Rhodococcus sp. B7740]
MCGVRSVLHVGLRSSRSCKPVSGVRAADRSFIRLLFDCCFPR